MDLVNTLKGYAEDDVIIVDYDKFQKTMKAAVTLINDLNDKIGDAHYAGYMAGVGDSEDYDHDPHKMEAQAWLDFLSGEQT